jgi:hypothetical protein
MTDLDGSLFTVVVADAMGEKLSQAVQSGELTLYSRIRSR